MKRKLKMVALLFNKVAFKIQITTKFTLLCILFSTVNSLAADNTKNETGVAKQEITVTGKVFDQNGQPIAGASVQVVGTTKGAITDVEGNYTISVPSAESQLKFSFVGYLAQTIVVGSQNTITVTLSEDLTSLEEIVVIGYGVQKKKLNTGATVNIGGDEIKSMNTNSTMDALKGISAGVQITQNNGSPGAGTKVNIRGIGTIGNYKPLYIVDGIAMGNIDYLSPSDIENIDVLKDAASAAIYGSRAANGVVLVTTKRGTKGSKMAITYDGYYGWQNVAKKPELLNAQQYAEIMNETRTNAGAAEWNFASLVPDWDKIESGEWKGTNWFDEITEKNAPIMSHSFNAAGGSEKSVYSFGASYYDQQGILGKQVNNDYKRLTVRFNSEHSLWEKNGRDVVLFGENITYTNEKKPALRTGSIYWNDIHNMLVASPFLPMYADTTTDEAYPYHYAIPWNTQESNPVAGMVNNGKYNTNNNNTIVANAYMEIQPVKNLKIRSSFGVNNWYSSSRHYTPSYSLADNNVSALDQVDQSMSCGYTWTSSNTISYFFSLNNIHNFSAVVGNEIIKNSRDLTVSGHNEGSIFEDPEYGYLSNVVGVTENTTLSGKDKYGWAMLSYFGRLSYDYKEKYLLTAVLRADGSSNFDAGHKWGTFPSVSAGWVISSEEFMQSLSSWLNYSKLRASWGQNGNQDIDKFQYLSNISYSNAYYFFGKDNYSTITSGAYPARVPNPDVSWETSEQLDLGLDMYFLSNQVQFSFDWYNKNTRDWLILAPSLATDGTSAAYVNGGSILNKGIELALRWNKQIGDFKFGISGSMTHNKNEVVEIPNEEGIIHGPTAVLAQGTEEMFRAQEGYPVGYFWGNKTDGILQNETDVANWVNADGIPYMTNAQPGDLRIVDLDKDGVIKSDMDDKTMIGDPHPDYIFGIQINLDYKGAYLQATGVANTGQQVAKSYRSFLDGPRNNYTTDIYERWHGEGTSNTVPRITSGAHWNNYVSDRFIEDADFFRISNVTIGYNMNNLFKKMPFEETRIYVTGQNLYVFTKYSGMDPEVGYAPEDSNDPKNDYKWGSGIDLGLYPSARTYMVGLSIKF